ncbi:hypothetical protein EDB83DRAFT_2549448, partial [Lactarius deliciosus]
MCLKAQAVAGGGDEIRLLVVSASDHPLPVVLSAQKKYSTTTLVQREPGQSDTDRGHPVNVIFALSFCTIKADFSSIPWSTTIAQNPSNIDIRDVRTIGNGSVGIVYCDRGNVGLDRQEQAEQADNDCDGVEETMVKDGGKTEERRKDNNNDHKVHEVRLTRAICYQICLIESLAFTVQDLYLLVPVCLRGSLADFVRTRSLSAEGNAELE